MTIATEFFNWSLKVDDPAYNRCSPNLIALKWELARRFQMTNNGCYVERDIRAGTVPSAHSHGAAIDENYPDRVIAKQTIIPWLIDNSAELGVQAIHDYFGSRVWRAGRTDGWRAQTPSPATGFGQAWALYFHIETNKTKWDDSTPVNVRLGVPVPAPLPPSGVAVFTRTIKPGDEGADVAFVQTVWRAPGSANGDKNIVVDGKNGPQTVNRTKEVQKVTGLTADGIIGPKTQAVIMKLANS